MMLCFYVLLLGICLGVEARDVVEHAQRRQQTGDDYRNGMNKNRQSSMVEIC